jgi:hypothetical protein
MNLNDGYKFINFVSNKELAGKTMQPHEYNVAAEASQIDFFNRELQKVRAHAATNKQSIFEIIELGHPLRAFIRIFTLVTIPVNGKVAVPPLFVDVRSARCKVASLPKPVSFVSDQHLNNRITNPLEVSPLDAPIASVRGQFIQVWPKTLTDFEMVYLKLPEKPYFGYALDSTTELPSYLSVDEKRARAVATASGSLTAGQSVTVTITEGDISRIIGNHVATGAETLLETIHALVADTNQRSVSFGYTAEVASDTTFNIYSPIGGGTAYNAYTIAGSGTGVTLSLAQFAADAGTAGSKQFEFDPIYHMEIYKNILANIGVNLSEERLMKYKQEFQVEGI